VLEGKELDRYVKEGEPVPDAEVVAAELRHGAEAEKKKAKEVPTEAIPAPAKPALPAPDQPTEEVPRGRRA
jgi:hypothetical protein